VGGASLTVRGLLGRRVSSTWPSTRSAARAGMPGTTWPRCRGQWERQARRQAGWQLVERTAGAGGRLACARQERCKAAKPPAQWLHWQQPLGGKRRPPCRGGPYRPTGECSLTHQDILEGVGAQRLASGIGISQGLGKGLWTGRPGEGRRVCKSRRGCAGRHQYDMQMQGSVQRLHGMLQTACDRREDPRRWYMRPAVWGD
jgi:hypothetical protein